MLAVACTATGDPTVEPFAGLQTSTPAVERAVQYCALWPALEAQTRQNQKRKSRIAELMFAVMNKANLGR